VSVLANIAAARWRSLRRVLGRLVEPSPASREERLIVCAGCGKHMVNPVDWHETGDSSWWVRLRCGACGSKREGEFSDDDVNRLERDLAPGVRAISAAVARLDRQRMEREADAFIAALARDLITPEDFERRLRR
jgi:hypothetical protein